MNNQRTKPKKAITERTATIMPITTRNTPFTISLMMPQRMPNIPKAVRTIRVHIASPMYCAICLKSAVAVIAVSFVKFHDAVNPAVKEIAECGLVGSLVFRPMPILLHDVGSENVGEVKPPALQGDCAFEIGVAVHFFGEPILFLSVHLSSVVQFFTQDVNLLPFSASNVGTSQATNFVAIAVPISVLFFDFYF